MIIIHYRSDILSEISSEISLRIAGWHPIPINISPSSSRTLHWPTGLMAWGRRTTRRRPAGAATWDGNPCPSGWWLMEWEQWWVTQLFVDVFLSDFAWWSMVDEIYKIVDEWIRACCWPCLFKAMFRGYMARNSKWSWIEIGVFAGRMVGGSRTLLS